MSNHIFTGSGVALITPMKSDGSVNYDVLGDLVEFHVQNGTDAIIVCGTTGEAATLSEKEHCETISFVAEKTNGRIPVIAGTGSNDTSTAVMLSKSAASTGVDALLCVTPYYNKTSQQGLVRHFNVVADSVDIPIILYNVPSRTGCNIKPKLIRSFASILTSLPQKRQAATSLRLLSSVHFAVIILTSTQVTMTRLFLSCHSALSVLSLYSQTSAQKKCMTSVSFVLTMTLQRHRSLTSTILSLCIYSSAMLTRSP